MRSKIRRLKQFLKLKSHKFLTFGVIPTICMMLSSCNNNLENKISNYVNLHQSDTLRVADFSDFKWDEVWIIAPSMHKKSLEIMKDKGIKTSGIEDLEKDKLGLGIRWAEYMDALVFIYSNKIVYRCYPPVRKPRTVDWCPRFYFQYPENTDIIVRSKDNAVFTIKNTELTPVY